MLNPKKRYKLIVFDFDGTLVDTAPDIAYYANVILEQNGFKPKSLRAVKKAVGWGVHDLLKNLAPDFEKSPKKLEKAVLRFKKLYRENPVRRTRPYPGVRQMLSGPLKNIKKAIVTNKPQDITERILDELSLRKHFLSLIGTYAGFEAKPDPTALLHVIRTLDEPLKKSIYIGDSKVDFETCRNAKVDFGWVNYGYDDITPLKPNFLFSHSKHWKKLA